MTDAPAPADDALGTVIADFLRDAGAGRVRSGARVRYTRAELRETRAALAHVAAELADTPIGAISAAQVRGLVDRLRDAGLPARRADAIVEALRAVFAYAIGHGLVAASPVVGLAPAAVEEWSPTAAVLTLGDRLAGALVWGIAIAFVAALAGLALAVA